MSIKWEQRIGQILATGCFVFLVGIVGLGIYKTLDNSSQKEAINGVSREMLLMKYYAQQRQQILREIEAAVPEPREPVLQAILTKWHNAPEIDPVLAKGLQERLETVFGKQVVVDT
jgi:hypothetical protein